MSSVFESDFYPKPNSSIGYYITRKIVSLGMYILSGLLIQCTKHGLNAILSVLWIFMEGNGIRILDIYLLFLHYDSDSLQKSWLDGVDTLFGSL